MSIERYGGGFGHDETCAAVNGAELLVWAFGRWIPLDDTTAGLGSSALMSGTITDPVELDALRTSSAEWLSFAATPKAPNGCGSPYGGVGTDYVEVTVEYRLSASTP